MQIVIRGMQVKTTVSYHVVPIRYLKSKGREQVLRGDVKKDLTHYLSNLKCCNCFGKQPGISSNIMIQHFHSQVCISRKTSTQKLSHKCLQQYYNRKKKVYQQMSEYAKCGISIQWNILCYNRYEVLIHATTQMNLGNISGEDSHKSLYMIPSI